MRLGHGLLRLWRPLYVSTLAAALASAALTAASVTTTAVASAAITAAFSTAFASPTLTTAHPTWRVCCARRLGHLHHRR